MATKPRSIPQALDADHPYVRRLFAALHTTSAEQDKAFMADDLLTEAEARGRHAAFLEALAILLNCDQAEAQALADAAQ